MINLSIWKAKATASWGTWKTISSIGMGTVEARVSGSLVSRDGIDVGNNRIEEVIDGRNRLPRALRSGDRHSGSRIRSGIVSGALVRRPGDDDSGSRGCYHCYKQCSLV